MTDKIKKFGEVFTPMWLVEAELLSGIDYSNPDLKILEPSFGDGRILLEIKKRLMLHHSEKHIIENMLYGIEIQEELFQDFMEVYNPQEYEHNLYNVSALKLDEDTCSALYGKMDHVVGNPPYNRNLAKKSEVDPSLWAPSGYTTKLAYCFFVVLAQKCLKEGGEIKYVIPCSFASNVNTQQFRHFMRETLSIKEIKILRPDAFPGVMIRTCIFKANCSKDGQRGEFTLTRDWQGKNYTSKTYYNQFGDIPLFIGKVSRSIFDKVMLMTDFPVAYKGWNGADSYAKFVSKDPDEHEFSYVHGVNRKKEVQIYSSSCKEKFKAKKNKKLNNVGCYKRFDLNKLMINEVKYGSFEATNHIKFILIDRDGKFGASPKNTIICMDREKLDEYSKDLRCRTTQMMLSVVKDYNHNDSHVMRYIPHKISALEKTLTEEEKQFLEKFDEIPESIVVEISDELVKENRERFISSQL